jgi:hypothetical protein
MHTSFVPFRALLVALAVFAPTISQAQTESIEPKVVVVPYPGLTDAGTVVEPAQTTVTTPAETPPPPPPSDPPPPTPETRTIEANMPPPPPPDPALVPSNDVMEIGRAHV